MMWRYRRWRYCRRGIHQPTRDVHILSVEDFGGVGAREVYAVKCRDCDVWEMVKAVET